MSSCASTSHDGTSCFLSVFLCLSCFQVCRGSVPLHLPPLCLNATRTRHQQRDTSLIFFFHSTRWATPLSAAAHDMGDTCECCATHNTYGHHAVHDTCKHHAVHNTCEHHAAHDTCARCATHDTSEHHAVPHCTTHDTSKHCTVHNTSRCCAMQDNACLTC